MTAPLPGGLTDGRTAAEVMVTAPKTLPSTATVGEVRAVFGDEHVHMVLLTRDGVLRGTLVRGDLPAGVPPAAPALPLAALAGRTVGPATPAGAVLAALLAGGERRRAVVGTDGRLLGLVCLTRRRTGFCSDAGVAARADAARQDPTGLSALRRPASPRRRRARGRPTAGGR